jgi:transcriptional regulator with XRE-family HTH domain
MIKKKADLYKLSEEELLFLKNELKEAQEKLENEEELVEFSEEYDLSDPDEIYEEILVNISFELTRIREQKDWSQTKLANESGKTQPKISKIENLTSDNPKIKTLVDIFFALGKTLYITPHKEYTYTVPEKNREAINKKAEETGISTNEVIEKSFDKGFTYYDVPLSQYEDFPNQNEQYSSYDEFDYKIFLNSKEVA